MRLSITPIVFSCHDDLEAWLAERIGSLRFTDVEHGTGFNPMRVAGIGPHAWIDTLGMLRDVFASIFRDFGDLQNNEIREGIKQSCQDEQFGIAGDERDQPCSSSRMALSPDRHVLASGGDDRLPRRPVAPAPPAFCPKDGRSYLPGRLSARQIPHTPTPPAFFVIPLT